MVGFPHDIKGEGEIVKGGCKETLFHYSNHNRGT